MTYDFDSIIPRRGTLSYKWDSAPEGVLPMWVADMDFKTAPAIIDALRRRVDNGIFGYTRVPDEYYDAVTSWFGRRHGWEIDREMMIYTSGVVPAISAIIKALAKPGEKVIVQTPVYNCFFSSIRNNGCRILESPLIKSGDTYAIDFDRLEKDASEPDTTLMLLCNPHNPAGRVWSCDELRKIAEICGRNGVTVISDEIHCEFVFDGYRYTPFATVSEEAGCKTVVCVSPSKAFNIAGLQIANIVAPDEGTRALIDKAININEVCDVNPFGVIATIAAYNEGEEWLSQLLKYIKGNYEYMKEFCKRNLPEFPIAKLEATYLVWMDCTKLGLKSEALEEKLIEDVSLWLNAGTMYGTVDGEGYMRWNIACPRRILADGLERFLDFTKKARTTPARSKS
ncbi:MAG: pyridoxal phosphate-dependent aminotransferase [Muribaculaceae bacterium]|nr:pyridoxal phosphate-dependent aminotransferase [Muribaculaceae bacterium]